MGSVNAFWEEERQEGSFVQKLAPPSGPALAPLDRLLRAQAPPCGLGDRVSVLSLNDACSPHPFLQEPTVGNPHSD